MNKPEKTIIHYLVEKSNVRGHNLIYEIQEDNTGAVVFLVQNFLGKQAVENCIGVVVKNNKRGLTFQSQYISNTQLTIFISNGHFKKLTPEEFKKYMSLNL